jgi:hypothetical protein
MKHVILTRVNLPMRLDPHKYKNTELFKSKEWNDRRFEMLNRFARPSLAKQTCQDFTHITLWGDMYEGGERPNEIKETVTDNGSPDCEPLNYRALWEDLPGKKTLNFSDQIADIVKKHFKPPLLITNLDADDALHYQYIELLQAEARKQSYRENFWFDTMKRYGYNVNTGQKWLRLKGRTVTAFCSTIEHEITCIPLRYNHPYIGTMFHGMKIPELSSLETINDSNMFSSAVGEPAEFDLNDYI